MLKINILMKYSLSCYLSFLSISYNISLQSVGDHGSSHIPFLYYAIIAMITW